MKEREQNWLLITVEDSDIATEQFASMEKAREKMEEELLNALHQDKIHVSSIQEALDTIDEDALYIRENDSVVNAYFEAYFNSDTWSYRWRIIKLQ